MTEKKLCFWCPHCCGRGWFKGVTITKREVVEKKVLTTTYREAPKVPCPDCMGTGLAS